MNAKRRIVITEDHTLMRVGLSALLSREADLEVVGEADNGRAAIALVDALVPDLVVMDLTMPGITGMDAIAEIKRGNPAVKVLVVTLHRADEYVHESLKAGADGYVLKDATHDELRIAIRSVLNGKMYLSPDISNKVINGYLSGPSGTGAGGWETVTHREREVLKLVAEGHSNRVIAQFLGLSIKTVETHRANLMRKLDLHNASMLTALAFEKGLVSNDRGAGGATDLGSLRPGMSA